VNAHATSTPVGDAAEAAALKSIFGDGAGAVAVSSTKSATGHMLGAAGAIEAVFSVLSLQTGVLPPSLNIEEPISEIRDFDLLRDGARRSQVNHVLLNAFGFGGVNAAPVFSRHS
jgi:3-oxoacyl-[acyl-carrier-protein] synthase II